jgi:GNAT superfamily N-acetyltransferase
MTLAAELTRLINDAYAAGEQGLWPEGVTRIDEPDVSTLVAAGEMITTTSGGRVVGCARVHMLDATTGGVSLISAARAAWGTGVGRELVARAEDIARRRGATAMQLELLDPREGTHPDKLRLRAWYERLGYRVVRTEPFEAFVPHAAPTAVPCDVLVFRKPLT